MTNWQEILRRVYHDLVRHRSRVLIAPAKQSELAYPPIFVTGVYRSGTTLLRYVLDSHSHISCPPESNFIIPLSQLVEHNIYGAGLDQMGFDQAHVVLRLRELIVYFFNNYAVAHGKVRWADKTPEYVNCLDFINLLFPEAKFLMIYRNGLDQAHSYTRGGSFMRSNLLSYHREGEDLRVAATRYWRDQVEKMLQFEQRYPEKCLYIRYEDLCAEPQMKLKSTFDFIGAPWEAQVLRYYEYPHDKGAEDGRVIATRGIMPARSYYPDWPTSLRQQCMEIAAPMLSKLGYISQQAEPSPSLRNEQ